MALSDISQGVLYGMFALTGLISGGISNRACTNYSCEIIEAETTLCSAGTKTNIVLWHARLCSLCRFTLVVSKSPQTLMIFPRHILDSSSLLRRSRHIASKHKAQDGS